MAALPPPRQAGAPAATSGTGSSLLNVPACHSMEEYDGLLRQKRRELDREIETFHARKEKEFLVFQRNLRAELNREKDRQREAEAAVAATVAVDAIKPIIESKDGVKPTDCTLDLDGANSPAAKQPHPLHTRDSELGGLFTPSYLPLLEGSVERVNGQSLVSGNNSSSDDNTGGKAKGKSIIANRRRKRSSAPLPLSSSLTLSRSLYDGSSQVPQASSAPRPGLADRRSSSRSDTSNAAGNALRSVLRQPRSPDGGAGGNGGKSPKHVLFSIDNTVVAPSSSPNLTRQPGKENGANAEDESSLQEGYEQKNGSLPGTAPSSNFAAAAQDPTTDHRTAAELTASVLSMRGIPPSLRMTPVRIPGPPTPPLGSLGSGEEEGYFNVPTSPAEQRMRHAETKLSPKLRSLPTSAPNPSTSVSNRQAPPSPKSQEPTSSKHMISGSSSTTNNFKPGMPLSIDTETAHYSVMMRRTSSGSSAPRTPSSANLASALLDTTVPAELQESAGAVPDVLEGTTDPLFDFGEGDESFEDMNSDEEAVESDGDGDLRFKEKTGKKRIPGKKKDNQRGRSELNRRSAEIKDELDDNDVDARRESSTSEGGLPASLPIEIKWPGRRRS